jgi:hypothetical protein
MCASTNGSRHIYRQAAEVDVDDKAGDNAKHRRPPVVRKLHSNHTSTCRRQQQQQQRHSGFGHCRVLKQVRSELK